MTLTGDQEGGGDRGDHRPRPGGYYPPRGAAGGRVSITPPFFASAKNTGTYGTLRRPPRPAVGKPRETTHAAVRALRLYCIGPGGG